MNLSTTSAAVPVFCRFPAGLVLRWLSWAHPPGWLCCACTSCWSPAGTWPACGNRSDPAASSDTLPPLTPACLPCLQWPLRYKQQSEGRITQLQLCWHTLFSKRDVTGLAAVTSHCFIFKCIIDTNLLNKTEISQPSSETDSHMPEIRARVSGSDIPKEFCGTTTSCARQSSQSTGTWYVLTGGLYRSRTQLLYENHHWQIRPRTVSWSLTKIYVVRKYWDHKFKINICVYYVHSYLTRSWYKKIMEKIYS